MPSRTGNEEADKKLEEYNIALQELAALAMSGKVNRGDFVREAIRISDHYTNMLFMLGGADMNNKDALLALDKLLEQNRRSSRKLAADIFSGKYNVE